MVIQYNFAKPMKEHRRTAALIAVAKIVGLRAVPCQMLLSNPKT